RNSLWGIRGCRSRTRSLARLRGHRRHCPHQLLCSDSARPRANRRRRMGPGADAVMTSTNHLFGMLTGDRVGPMAVEQLFGVMLTANASRDCGSGGGGNFVVSRGILPLACNYLEYAPPQLK